jgi:isoleucyl-tRNA synthetase
LKKFKEHKTLNLPEISREILAFWNAGKIFEKSISSREGKPGFVFYEGPPSANGMPGIHHVMARTIKDLFCRYQTLKGKQVHRKAGWDTHGLPIELAVEKTLGITKEDIGKKISVEDYNKACRKEVMKYTDKWEELTEQMGYWVDMKSPYVTYETPYMESVWWLLKQLYDKKLLYKGYAIQPYSPAAGTGLSSHELNQPGCYRNVKDTSVVAQFKVQETEKLPFKPVDGEEVFFLAWTTTPWTLPSNCALAIGEKIEYAAIRSFNPYTYKPLVCILARELVGKYFPEKNAGLPLGEYKAGDKQVPFEVVAHFPGSALTGIHYEQLLPFVQPESGDAFRVIPGDFVTTEDGTGIVHTASVFGADDYRVCKENGVPSILIRDEEGNLSPLVDKRGKFVAQVADPVFGLGGEFVKEEYLNEKEKEQELAVQKERLKEIIPKLEQYLSVDERIALKLKIENKAFRIEKFEHSYPHCWRTDKPVLYYPLDSWFIRVTEPSVKARMIELNKTIYWKPEHTGTGRFGEWLNNLQDWNLSRSRFWGIPLPVWRSEDGKEETCIGSLEDLKNEIAKAEKAGIKNDFVIEPGKTDLHKPYIDRIVLLSPSGKKMYREKDLIDVWFDSGSMPFAQWHYPFENKDLIDSGKSFPADFIAEGVDQTRGWFYTLHAISTMVFDSVSYKAVVSNGLVLDKNGNKMSKRLGNAVDPFETMDKYGPDAVRWYMVSNAAPWENLRFDPDGITEKQRTFFGTLFNTYSFFALYANIDGYSYDASKAVPVSERPELDRWIISRLNSLTRLVSTHFDKYDPTPACRAIENFAGEHLSNWFVRLSRRRFWALKGGAVDPVRKQAAYDTLFECLNGIALLMSPVAPFYADWLYKNLHPEAASRGDLSVHLAFLPEINEGAINRDLEEKMELAQKITSMALSIRKKENIRVRQPLHRIRIPVLHEKTKKQIESVSDLILSEINVKQIEFVDENSGEIVKNLKLNFKTLGKKCGKNMKAVQEIAREKAQEVIRGIETKGLFEIFSLDGELIVLEPEDVEIIPVDIPGWKVANQGAVTVALDISITPELKEEGLAREIVNRVQNMRKDRGFEVTDRIRMRINPENELVSSAIKNNLNYICSETLTANTQTVIVSETPQNAQRVELDENVRAWIEIEKSN